MNYIQRLGASARAAQADLSAAGTMLRNDALLEIAHILRRCSGEITAANARDIKAAEAKGLDTDILDRLRLTERKIEAMAQLCEELSTLDDPVGEILGGEVRPNGMRVQRVRSPIGVVGVIYETRPDLTAQAAALCIKSGNAVILRGAREAYQTNKCFVELMRRAVGLAGLPQDIIQFVEDTDRGTAIEMMQARGSIDLLIPRGGAQFVRAVVKTAQIPVIETGGGSAHVYVDAGAEIDMAAEIIENGITMRRSDCGGVGCCLVHRYAAEDLLPKLKERLDEQGVRIRGCELTRVILGADSAGQVTETDFEGDSGDGILAVKVTDGLGEAIEHIQRYGRGLAECIVTESVFSEEEFQKRIDAAAVYVNCSVSLIGGNDLGMGADVGITAGRLHARGPIGLKDLTTVKWLINGDGQMRD